MCRRGVQEEPIVMHRERWCLRCTGLEAVQMHCGVHSLLTAEAWWGGGDGACPLPRHPSFLTVVSPWKVVEEYVLNVWSALGGLERSSIN